jgi:tetratricopeptide (TPR) repeat protein
MPDRLIARAEQLARVTAVLEARPEAGRGHLLIEGESGSGKTALLRATARLAEQRGYRVARAQAHRRERNFPFGVVWQLFDPLLAMVDEHDRRQLMTGAAAPAAALFALDQASLDQAGPDPAGLDQGGPDAADPALRHALRELAGRLAGPRPLLFAVDDVHWADPESLSWLTYLVREPGRSPESVPIMVAVTHTPGTGASAPADLLSGLEVVPLPRFSAGDIAALARETLGADPDASLVQACHQATNGNAFLVTEYLRAAAAEREPAEPVPRRVTRWVSSRIGQLSPDALRLAQAIVVLGDGAGVPAVAALAGLAADETAALVASLAQMGFLTADGPGFAHRVARTAVDQTIGPEARRAAHARAATILFEARRPAAHVAEHLLATGPIGRRWAAETLRTAADEALRTAADDGAPRGQGDSAPRGGALIRAVDYLRRALGEPVDSGLRAELLAGLGHTELRTDAKGFAGAAAGISAAIEHLAEAYEIVRDLPLLARIAEDLATAYHHDAAVATATKVLDQAVDRLAPGHQDLADDLDALALVMAEPTAESSAARFDRLRAKAGHRAERSVTATAVRARQAVLAGGSDEAVAAARWVVEAGPPATMRRMLEYNAAAGALCCADYLDLAGRCATDMIAHAETAGGAVLGHAMAARVAFLDGRLDEAIDEARIAGRIQATLNGRAHDVARLWELAALLTKGDEETTTAILTDLGMFGEAATTWLGGGAAPGPPAPTASALIGLRGLLRELRGDLEAALADHLECGRRLTAAGVVNPALAPWRSRAALLCCRLRRRDEALRLASEELGLARRWGTARTLGVALRALGVAAGGPDGLSLLEESVSLLARSSARVEHASALYDLGRVLGESGRQEDARPLLDESYRLAGDCGADALAALCATEIKKVGGRRPRARRLAD